MKIRSCGLDRTYNPAHEDKDRSWSCPSLGRWGWSEESAPEGIPGLAAWWPWTTSTVTLYFSDGRFVVPMSWRMTRNADLPRATRQALIGGPTARSGLKNPVVESARRAPLLSYASANGSYASANGLLAVPVSATTPRAALTTYSDLMRTPQPRHELGSRGRSPRGTDRQRRLDGGAEETARTGPGA